jgi:ribose/xylose/arabinose/galactoside ABC-type transport system permease subunit
MTEMPVWNKMLNGTATRAVGLFVLVTIWLSLYAPAALSNPAFVLSRAAVTGMIAIGLTLVFIVGELDLSVGSVSAAAGGVMVIAPGPLAVQVLVAVAFGVAVGLVNGVLVGYFGVNSFIATLGTMLAVRGLALQFTGSEPKPLPHAFDAISLMTREIMGYSVKCWTFLLVVVLAAVFLARTRVGRNLFAVGGNREAARSAGINVGASKILAFAMCGGIAALAGALDAMSLGAADPTAGQNALLVGVSAAVIGGCLLTGGRGSALGTALGAVAVSALAVGLGFRGTDASVQTIVTGVVLLIAIVSDRALIARMRRSLKRRRITRGAIDSPVNHERVSA